MTGYLLRRLVTLPALLLSVATVVFVALQFMPGDPAVLMLGQDATPGSIAKLRQELGLNRPLLARYVAYVAGVTRGDLGRSFRTHLPVRQELLRTYPVTLTLTVGAMALSSLLGLSAGVLSSVWRYSAVDYIVRALILTAVSAPVFWFGLVLIYWLSIRFPLFPVSGWGTPSHIVLPILALSTYPLASIARLARSGILDVLSQDYVRTARAKGQSEPRVLTTHVLKNALIPVMTTIGLQFGVLLGGAVITERVFALPGLGTLVVSAVLDRDYALIQGVVLLIALGFALVNLVVDVLYGVLDPRLRYT